MREHVTALALSLAVVIGGVFVFNAVDAKNPDGSITLTPSKLYELIEVEQKKSKHQTAILELLRGRVSEIQKEADGIRQRANDAAVNHEQRIVELERKVAGVQKQVTILHAKKADKQ